MRKKIYSAAIFSLLSLASVCAQQAPFHPSKQGERKHSVPFHIPSPRFSDIESVVVVEEHFDNFTAGTPDAPDSENIGGSSQNGYRIQDGKMSMEGWTGNHVYQAGGSCALKAYESYGYTYYGHISTPEMELFGETTITLRARRATGATPETKLAVSLCDNTSGVEDYKDFDLTEEWQSFEFTSEKATFNNKNIFQIEGKKGEILIDDVKVTRKRNKLPAPVANPVINISNTSFKASWSAVSGVSEYIFNVYYKEMPEHVIPEGVMKEGFDGINLKEDGNIDTANPNYPTGWVIDVSANGSKDVLTTSGDFSSGKLSLNMDAKGDMIISAPTPAPIKKLSFWVKPSSMEIPADYNYSLLGVYIKRTNGDWEHIANLPNYWMQADGGFYTIEGDAIGEYVEQVKIDIVQVANNVTFAVDDVTLTYESQPIPKPFLKDMVTAETSKIVEGIDPAKEYYYYVQSKDGELVSKPSSVIWVDGIVELKPQALPATDVTSDSFKAQWEIMPHAGSYILNLYQDIVTKEDNETITLLHEDFNKITEGTVDSPASPQYYTPQLSLAKEGMADTDWTVLYPIWANGMIGGKEMNEWTGAIGLVATPHLPLWGGGNVEVDFVAVNTAVSDTLFVLIMKSPTDPVAVMGYQVPFEEGKVGSINGKVVFPEAYLNEYLNKNDSYCLAFTSQKGKRFFMDEVTVRQVRKQKGETVRVPKKLVYVEGSSCVFNGLEAGGRYAYDVRGYRMKDFKEYLSDYSDEITVMLPTSIRDAKDEMIRVIGTREGIVIENDKSSHVEIYDAVGRKVYASFMAGGRHSIRLQPSVYIVKVNHQRVKVSVR